MLKYGKHAMLCTGLVFWQWDYTPYVDRKHCVGIRLTHHAVYRAGDLGMGLLAPFQQEPPHRYTSDVQCCVQGWCSGSGATRRMWTEATLRAACTALPSK